MKRSRVLVLLVACLAVSASLVAHASDEIRARIQEQQQKIQGLEAEIARFEAELIEIGRSKQTLQSEVGRLDVSRKKIGADIALTQQKISAANLELTRLGEQIADKEERIINGRSAIGESFRTLSQVDDTTILEHVLSVRGPSGAWEEVDRLVSLQGTITATIQELARVRLELSSDRDEVADQRQRLSSLSKSLTGQKTVLDNNRAEQASLLSATRSKETEYQRILEEKRRAKIQFEAELNQFESQLEYSLDPASIPAAGSGVLRFPLDPAYMQRCRDRTATFKNQYCITQYFGDTPFARSGAYNGKGHNGVDFGAPDGTQVVAALSGVVQAVGNTDMYRGCYSYGKWVLIKHNNGLSTLYAHLSHTAVGEGAVVQTGTPLGYSGKTGYATGPHLHFTLYASNSVRMVRMGDIKEKTNCANAIVPVAATSGYLNPMSYL